MLSLYFFFNDTATTEIYTLSLHDALPISRRGAVRDLLHRLGQPVRPRPAGGGRDGPGARRNQRRSEEHTSELQSRQYLVCRLLLEKKNILCISLLYFLSQHSLWWYRILLP